MNDIPEWVVPVSAAVGIVLSIAGLFWRIGRAEGTVTEKVSGLQQQTDNQFGYVNSAIKELRKDTRILHGRIDGLHMQQNNTGLGVEFEVGRDAPETRRIIVAGRRSEDVRRHRFG
ncbi:MAG: hypothetical protein OXR64_02890 [Chloroflexota bacterium]|nr:hypothetical protein [Chloroflexota bacterium]